MSERPLVIVNPAAANGRAGREWPALRRRIEREAGTVDVRMTEHATHATELAREALQRGYRTIGSLGGDGTHSMVVNGFFEGGEPIAEDASLAILPFGTGGDFKRMLPIRGDDFDDFARALVGAPPVPIDIGHIELEGEDGAPIEQVFLNIASWGVSGLVDRYVNTTTKRFGAKVSYLLASARGILSYDIPLVRMTADGEELPPLPLFLAGACNGRYFGGGMMFGPRADLRDGLLDLVIMPWSGRFHHLTKGAEIYAGRHVERPGVRMLRVTELTAESDADCWIDIDGENPGRLPLRIRVLAGALRLRGLPHGP